MQKGQALTQVAPLGWGQADPGLSRAVREQGRPMLLKVSGVWRKKKKRKKNHKQKQKFFCIHSTHWAVRLPSGAPLLPCQAGFPCCLAPFPAGTHLTGKGLHLPGALLA